MSVPGTNDIKIIGKTNAGHFFQTIAINAKQIDKCLAQMKAIGIKNLSINSEWGWDGRIKKLSFLKDNDWIEGVDIVDENMDVSEINYLSNLKRIQLPDSFKGILDFNNFRNLEVFRTKWNEKQFNSVYELKNIRYLLVTHFNHPNLVLFGNYNNLEDFEITYSKLISLEGIKKMTHLKRLSLFKLSKLVDISELRSIKTSLKDLDIIGCKNLVDYKDIKGLTELENLGLGDGNPIDSVEFLRGLKVKAGFIGVEILDKNVDILLKRNIGFKKNRGYDSREKI